MSQSNPFPTLSLVSPEGFTGEGASLFQTSLMEEIRDPNFTSSFHAALFLAQGLVWERGLIASSPPAI